MKNFFFTFLKCTAVTAILMVFCMIPAFAQGTLDPSDPNSFIDSENTSPLLMGLVMLLSYFSGVFPGLAKIKIAWLRSAVVAIVVIAGAATFKFGFFTKETVQYLVEGFFPNFAYSGFAYEAIKAILKIFGIEMKSLKTTATA